MVRPFLLKRRVRTTITFACEYPSWPIRLCWKQAGVTQAFAVDLLKQLVEGEQDRERFEALVQQTIDDLPGGPA